MFFKQVVSFFIYFKALTCGSCKHQDEHLNLNHWLVCFSGENTSLDAF